MYWDYYWVVSAPRCKQNFKNESEQSGPISEYLMNPGPSCGWSVSRLVGWKNPLVSKNRVHLSSVLQLQSTVCRSADCWLLSRKDKDKKKEESDYWKLVSGKSWWTMYYLHTHIFLGKSTLRSMSLQQFWPHSVHTLAVTFIMKWSPHLRPLWKFLRWVLWICA